MASASSSVRGIARPAAEVVFDADGVADVGAFEHDLEELDGPGVIVDAVALGAVALLAGDEDDFLRADRRTAASLDAGGLADKADNEGNRQKWRQQWQT